MGNLTRTVSGGVVNFKSAARAPIESLKCYFEPVQSGSGDPSPTNVRPISGWTGLTATRCGKNLLDLSAAEFGYIKKSGVVVADNYEFSTEYLPYPAGIQTTASINQLGTLNACIFDKNKGIIRREGDGNPQAKSCISGAATADGYFRWFICPKPNKWHDNLSDFLAEEPQIEFGTEVTAYEPYNGSKHTITWQSEAGEVYTGYFDFISGELVLTHALCTLTGTESDAVWSWNGYLIHKPDSVNSNAGRYVTHCSHTKYVVNGGTYFTNRESSDPVTFCQCCASSGEQLRFRNRFLTDAYSTKEEKLAAIRSWLQEQYNAGTPVQIVYELATPAHYQLTPQQIKTLLGTNNIWSDANGQTEVTYAIHDAAPIRAAKHRIAANEPHLETAHGGIATFDSSLVAPLKSLRVDFAPVQSGSGVSSPDNIRSISGWTGINATKCGKNLFNTADAVFGYVTSDGTILSARNNWCSDYIKVSPQEQITCSMSFCDDSGSGPQVAFFADTNAESMVQRANASAKAYQRTYIVPYNAKYMRAWFNPGAYSVVPSEQWVRENVQCQIETGIVATDYEPNTESTISVSWQSEAGTVYGGYVDLISGDLVATHGAVVMDGTQSTTMSNNGRFFITTLPDMKGSTGCNDGYSFCDKIQLVITMADVGTDTLAFRIGDNNNNKLYFYHFDTKLSIKTLAAFNAWCAENQPIITYPLATPVHYQLTPQQIKALRRNNCILSNGENTTVKYWTNYKYPQANVLSSFNLTATNNNYTQVNANTYSPGDVITATVLSTNTTVIPTRYHNGYFDFSTPTLEFDKYYYFSADVNVLENKLRTDVVGIASVGVGSTEVIGEIKNGKILICFKFIKKSGSNDKYLEFHLGGKSMELQNIRIVEI